MLLKTHLDKLKDKSGPSYIEDKLLSILSYGAVVGGCLSEYNLVTLLAYVGVDLKDEVENLIISEMIAFYAGTGLIDFIDNGIGLYKYSINKESKTYQLGKLCDTTDIKNAIDVLKNNIMEPKEHVDMSNRKEKLGNTYCPKCRMSVAITDKEKFIIHYPDGLSNPYAEVICERCSHRYNIETTWANAYIFDSRGCKAVPYSFARGEKINESYINDFIEHFDDSLESFLDIVRKEKD